MKHQRTPLEARPRAHTYLRPAASPRKAISATDLAAFTLIELLLAIMITAMVMVSVSATFLGLLQARAEVSTLSESTEAGPRILTLIERDLRGLWHFDVKNNMVLLGRNMNSAGFDADRIDFLTTTDAIAVVMDTHGEAQRPSISEVGYWLKENPRIPGLLELWRREDPMIDDDLRSGGHFQLVHDRIKNFNITYYETLGKDAEPLLQWDSSKEDKLPRRIKIEFTIERKLANRNRVSGFEVANDSGAALVKYTRHILLDRRYPEILQPNVALMPMLPPRPTEEGAGGGAGIAPGTGGGANVGGRGSKTDGEAKGTGGTTGGRAGSGGNTGGDAGRRGGGSRGGGGNLGGLLPGGGGGGNLGGFFGGGGNRGN